MAGTNRLRATSLVLACVLALLLLLGIFFTSITAPALAKKSSSSPPHQQPERFVPGEVLVKFEPGASGQERAEAHRQNDAAVEEIIPDIGVRVVKVPVGQEQSAVAAYERNPNVSYAELDTIVRVADLGDPQDPRLGEQWQYNNTGQSGGTNDADIDALEAWRVTRGSNDVAIAILDTGIDQSHEDLSSKIVPEMNHNFTTSKTVDDKYGHGTHVAGSVAAVTDNDLGVAGTCPDCVLYNVKVVGNNGSGRLSWLIKGILWSVDPDNNGNTDDGAEVISMSLSTPSGSRALRDAVNEAWNKGAVLVAAAGNYGGTKLRYPAAYPNVIAVAATNQKDNKPRFSSYGKKWVDIGAPGASILSTLPGNDRSPEGRYAFETGTSMATPHVAGVAGLVWSTNLCNAGDNTCVRDRIETRADQIPGLADYWPDGRRLNALKSVSP